MKLKLFILAIFATVISGCSLDDGNPSCYFQAAMRTISVTGPDTAVVNTTINYNVKFLIANACGSFNHFAETEGFPKSVVAAVDYSGCNCSETQSTDTKPYSFKPTAVGTYVFRFITEDEDAPIVKTLTVTAE